MFADAHGALGHVCLKPPPSRCWCTVTLSVGRPAALAAYCWTRAMACVPIQTSHEFGVTCTVQFIGSIVACARNGISYSASNRSPCDSPLAMSPTDFATTPSFLLAARRSSQISAELILALGPSSQVILSASRPFLAAHM